MKPPTRWIAGLIVGAALMLAPVIGIAVTVFGMIRAFHSVAQADPAMKSQMLADGIAEAMNFTAFGILLFIPGVVIAALCLWRLLAGRRAATNRAPAPPAGS